MLKKQIGIMGLAVMGSNLALNIAHHNYTVSVFNRSSKRTMHLLNKYKGNKIFPYYSIKDFVFSLDKPRCILLMVQAGKATDESIAAIVPYLNKNDILIDGGNSFYKDTIRRNYALSKIGLNFIGARISGGEDGALKGPSIMPGGQQSAYKLIEPILKNISAKLENKEPCVDYIGPDGSGHYVKMVHNGIEYSDMQLIAETYFLLKNLVLMDNEELAKTFKIWNTGELNSYLISITENIFKKKDHNGVYLIDVILDQAEHKGTGKWTSQSALNLGEPLSLITESVFSRYLSSLKLQRITASRLLMGPEINKIIFNKIDFIEKTRRALYLGKIISYAQGFSQLRSASIFYKWNLQYGKIAKIFRSGCIIRANFLQKITDAYLENENIENLLLTSYFKNIANQYQMALREIVSYAITNGIPVPAFASAISYYDSYRAAILPANLIQAQRDYFGAHTYKRIDKDGIFHTDWLN